MSDFSTEYGARVRAARTRAGLSQTDLGTLVGLTRSSVANVEAGRQASSAEQAVTIANALGVGVQWLLTGDTKIAPPRSPIDRRHVVRDLDAALGTDP